MAASNAIELTYRSPTMVLTFAGAFHRISSPGEMSLKRECETGRVAGGNEVRELRMYKCCTWDYP